MTPPAEFPPTAETDFEAQAYQAAENAAEEDGPRNYRHDYAHLGPAISEKPYRPSVLREWPMHTDFRPEELEVRD